MDNNSLEYLITAGEKAFNSKKYEEAIDYFTKAENLSHDNFDILFNWGNALKELAFINNDEELYLKAFDKYEEVLENQPNNAIFLLKYGEALLELADINNDEILYKEAIENLEKSNKIKPFNYFTLFYLGLALSALAELECDEILYKEAIEKYKEGLKLKPDDSYIYSKLGEAFFNLFYFNNDEFFYKEAMSNFETSTLIDPNNAHYYYFWGIELLDLASDKKDEILYKEAIEKFKKAALLEPNDAEYYHNWGNTLFNLASLKCDESLFIEAIKKYEKAILLRPDYASTYYRWGNALFEFTSKIKQDEFLCNEAIEKYKNAEQLNLNYAPLYFWWGEALVFLAKINEDEILYKKAVGKYRKCINMDPEYTSAYLKLGTTYFELSRIIKQDSLLEEAIVCFKKSKTDILNILVNFDKNYKEFIINTNILYPLLQHDSNTDDSNFFYEITKSIKNKEKLDEYKKIYILSIFIISLLHVKHKNEKLVAHYQKKQITKKMLFGDSKFRLNAINYSNDPTEGLILYDYLFKEKKNHEEINANTEYRAFAGCFIFNYDSLNQFRLYGKEDNKEGTGLSLVFETSFFNDEPKMATENNNATNNTPDEKHALFRCIYIDPITKRLETVGHKEDYLFYREIAKGETVIDVNKACKDYRNFINELIEDIRDKMEELKKLSETLKPEIVGQLLINLRYLTKDIAFKEEQECRIIKIFRLYDSKINMIDDFNHMFVEYNPKVSNYIKKIYFGPKATEMELFKDMLKRKKLVIPCEKSKNPLA